MAAELSPVSAVPGPEHVCRASLWERMGHASSRAALIYLHSKDERQRKLAAAVGKVARAELRKGQEA